MNILSNIAGLIAGRITQAVIPTLRARMDRSAQAMRGGMGRIGAKADLPAGAGGSSGDAGDGGRGQGGESVTGGRAQGFGGWKPRNAGPGIGFQLREWAGDIKNLFTGIKLPVSSINRTVNGLSDGSSEQPITIARGRNRSSSDSSSSFSLNPSRGRAGGAGVDGSSPVGSSTSPGLLGRITSLFTRKKIEDESPEGNRGNLSWWQRGWANNKGGRAGNAGGKRSAFVRSARLQALSQARFSKADRAARTYLKQKGSNPNWHAAKMGQLLASRRSAKRRLGQVAGLQAKATQLGAAASSRVAAGLASLAGKLPMLATRLALPVSLAVAVAKLPFQLSKMNDSRIESLREGTKYNGRLAAAFARYDAKTENLKALSARDTAGSTSWLIDQQNEFRSNLRPIRDLFTNAMNSGLGAGTWALNRFADYERGKVLAGQAVWKEIEDMRNGKGFNPADFLQNFKDLLAKDAAKKAADEKVVSQQFTSNLGGWSDAMRVDGLQNNRFNNVIKRPIPPLR